jgi:5'-nucleotidase
VAVVLLAAAVGVVFGSAVALRGRSFGAPVTSAAVARPTFVIASPPSPTAEPSESPRPATVLPAAADEYVVESGDTLRSIAERVYGDAAQWSRIYEANRTAIGPDPDTITAGTRLTIPRP